MKGIKGFIPCSFVDWPGRVCSVIFLGGCNLKCPGCHNSTIAWTPDALSDESLDSIFEYLLSRKEWIDGVTITGGEPLLFPHLVKLSWMMKPFGKVKLDTNGTLPDELFEFLMTGNYSAIYMDVKSHPWKDDRYSAIAGTHVDTDRIRKSIEYLKEAKPGTEIMFRTTLFPGVTEEDLSAIRSAIRQELPGSRHLVQPYVERRVP